MTRPADRRLTKSKVNSPPRGLQSLLGNVNQGINPHELNHEIQPTTDLLPFWGVDKLRTSSTSVSVAGVIGQGTNLIVPEGELWCVYAASVRWSMAVGESATLALRLFDPGVAIGNIMNLSQETLLAAPATAVIGTGIRFPQPLILPSAWGFRGEIFMATIATSILMTLNVTYIKMDA